MLKKLQILTKIFLAMNTKYHTHWNCSKRQILELMLTKIISGSWTRTKTVLENYACTRKTLVTC